MYHEGEWFDLPTFYQRICDLPRLEPPAPNDINENHNECSPNQASASGDSSTNTDDDLSELKASVENKNINENYNECSTTQSSEDSSTKPDDGGCEDDEDKEDDDEEDDEDSKGWNNQDQHHNTCDNFVKDSSTNPNDDLSGLEVSVDNKNMNENYNEYSPKQASEDSSMNPDHYLSDLEVSVENKNINETYNECLTTQSSEDSSTKPDDDGGYGGENDDEEDDEEEDEDGKGGNYQDQHHTTCGNFIKDSSTNPDDYLSGLEVSVENKNINENYSECSTTQSSEDSSIKPNDDGSCGGEDDDEEYDEEEDDEEDGKGENNEDQHNTTCDNSSTNPDDYLSGLEVSVENKNINETYNECLTTQSSEDSSTKPGDDGGCGGEDDEEDDDEDGKGRNNQDPHNATCDNFVKDSMEKLTSRDLQKTESRDTDENSFSILVQKPLCGNDNVGKFESFMDEKDVESRIVYEPSLGMKSEATIEDAILESDLTTGNLGYNLESIDSSYQSSFLEVNKEGRSGIDYDSLLGLKSEASIEDAFFGSNLTTKTLGCYSESINSSLQSSFPEAKEGISRIADDSSLMQKTEAPVGDTLFGNDRFTENPEKVRDAITEDKSRIHNDPSFGLKRKVSCKETLKYGTTEYPESVQNDVKEDKSRIDNDPSLELKTDVPVKEKLLDCDETTKNLETVQKSIPEGSSFKEDNIVNPPLSENDECTYYYPTRSKTMMEVIQVCRSLDKVEDDPILRCRIGFTCNFCGDQFSSREKLREHVKTQMYGKFVPSGAYICSRYSTRYCIVLGYNSSGRVQYKCSHCLKRFKRFGDYARHCNNEKICKRYQSYLVSPLVHPCLLDNDEEGFECLFCHDSSTDYADLRFHECVMKRDPPEKCYEDSPADEDADDDGVDDVDDDVDDDGVDDDDGSVDDGGVSDDSTDESIKCDLCGVEFHGSQIYADHRREHASGEKYECKICYQSFKRLCSFKTHMAANHKVKTRAKKERSAKRKP